MKNEFKEIFNAISTGVIVHNQGQILFTNPYVSQITGYSGAELETMKAWDLIHPDFHGVVKLMMERRLKNEEVPDHYEIKALKRNGEDLWVEVYPRNFNFKDQQP